MIDRTKMRMTGMGLLVMVLGVLLAPASASAQSWRWQLDDERYRRMNQFERAQYDKAASLVQQQNYRAAAGEFEKFKLQFGNSPNLSYILFMHGYSLHHAKDRNAAIKAYHEVVDFFGEQTNDAGAALYHIGKAHLDNGDTLQGLQVLKKMTEDERYRDHPLAAGAIRQLADNHWRNSEFDDAVLNWQKVIRDFPTGGHAREATNSLIACQTLREQLPLAEQFLIGMADPKDREDPAHRQKIAEQIWSQARGTLWHYRHHPQTLPRELGEKITPSQGDAMDDWFLSTRQWWEQTDNVWEWHVRSATNLVNFTSARPDRRKRLEEAVQSARAAQDPAAGDKQLARLADICRQGGEFELGNYCLEQMRDRPWAQFKAHEMLTGQNEFAKAAELLEDLETSGDSEWARRAKHSRAELYRHRLNRQEDAIKLYTELNNPPDTLWAIQDSYMRMGNLKESIRTLREIQNMFPDHAARALWQQAENTHRSGDKKQAATYARALLTHFKDSPESSRAHQLLEDYGIQTGGGVIHE